MKVLRVAAIAIGSTLVLGVPAAGAKPDRPVYTWDYAHGDQGRSGSDPDGLSNGGPDKPHHQGGFDSDRDGNNGCGNDDDFEDDNNGRCGGRGTGAGEGEEPAKGFEAAGRPAGVAPGVVSDAGSPAPATAAPVVTTEVMGLQLERTVDGQATPAPVHDPDGATEVLGLQVERPGALARTGAGLGALGLLGASLVGSGRLARRFGRR